MAAKGIPVAMLGSKEEPPPSVYPGGDADVLLRPLPSPPLAVSAPVPDHARGTRVSPPPIAVTGPAPPPAHAPVATDEGRVVLQTTILTAVAEKRRPPTAPAKKRLRSPLMPLVGSPGINILLSQSSPKSIGVKRPSPEPAAIPCLSHRSKRRKLKSEIWKDFDPVYDGNKLKEAKCKHCKRVFVATRDAGTSHCIRHLLVCEERAKVNEFLDSMKSTMSHSQSENWKYDPEKAHWDLVRMIVLHELPFRIVEYIGFRQFVHSLNPTFELVSRSTIRNDCVDLYTEIKIKLKESLGELNSRVSLTSDLWTSNQVVSYMCITCHYLDAKWNLKKKVIWFAEADTPHDGINLFNIMLECLQDWGLQNKIFSITLDNASNNNLCVSYMQSNLLGKGLLPCKGDLLHARCAAHVINLIAQDGLAISCMAVDYIRESIKFIRSSPPRKKKFKDIVAQEGISCTQGLSLDAPTRWNSTHLMIKTALEYRRAFSALKLQDTSYTYLPTNDEWETVQSVCNLLEVFLDATMVVSGTLYPTAHLYFHELWKIHLKLEREANHGEEVIKSMVKAMRKKFTKYWKLSYVNICLPVILDPRYKFKFLEFCLKSGFESEAGKCLAKVKKTFKELFVEYSSHDGDSMECDQGASNASTSIDNPWAEWKERVKEQQKQRAKLSELDVYLKDEVCQQEDDFDILCWWSANAQKYPVLSRIAKDVLAAPVSSVASESAFSTGGRVLSDYRSRLLSSTVQALICLQDWMRPRGSSRVSTVTSDLIYAKNNVDGRNTDIFGD